MAVLREKSVKYYGSLLTSSVDAALLGNNQELTEETKVKITIYDIPTCACSCHTCNDELALDLMRVAPMNTNVTALSEQSDLDIELFAE